MANISPSVVCDFCGKSEFQGVGENLQFQKPLGWGEIWAGMPKANSKRIAIFDLCPCCLDTSLRLMEAFGAIKDGGGS